MWKKKHKGLTELIKNRLNTILHLSPGLMKQFQENPSYYCMAIYPTHVTNINGDMKTYARSRLCWWWRLGDNFIRQQRNLPLPQLPPNRESQINTCSNLQLKIPNSGSREKVYLFFFCLFVCLFIFLFKPISVFYVDWGAWSSSLFASACSWSLFRPSLWRPTGFGRSILCFSRCTIWRGIWLSSL